MTELKGMTWNHERGIKPLIAASRIFKEKFGVSISWDARSLSDFELFPIELLADKYDLIMIDHPHIGVSYAKKLLEPLDGLISPQILHSQRIGTVGKSFESYTWQGKQYALPLDAAAQVSAVREDIVVEIPETFEDVLSLPDVLGKQYAIAVPFAPVHAYSSFFTVSSHFSDKLFWTNEEDLDINIGVKTLDMLERLLKISDPISFESDPIDILEEMSTGDRIVYSPLIYGYSNYSRTDYDKHIVKFYNMPRENALPNGSMIGGVGLAITQKSKHKEVAAEFAAMACDPCFQKTVIFDNGGQPGHIEAWEDEHVNEMSNNFFLDTLATLENGSLRPRFNGYIDFQAEAGKQIRAYIQQDRNDKEDFIAGLNELIRTCRKNEGLKTKRGL